jgi:hypothetical protein
VGSCGYAVGCCMAFEVCNCERLGEDCMVFEPCCRGYSGEESVESGTYCCG